ncbi:MAG: hypothetical protein HUJ96_10205 [Marinilabiliaceae bacterium]|nr:hypothetical protein [Marinilabiliaceae bacterium]
MTETDAWLYIEAMSKGVLLRKIRANGGVLKVSEYRDWEFYKEVVEVREDPDDRDDYSYENYE